MGHVAIQTMTESGVHQIVHTAFETYEKEIAQPRHLETTGQLAQLLRTSDKIEGGVTAIKLTLKYLGSAILVLAALMKIIVAVRGH